MELWGTAGGNVKWCSRCGKQFSDSSELNTELPHDPAMPLKGVYPEELKAGTQTDTYMPMFTAALFIVTKRWKRPECPSTDE